MGGRLLVVGDDVHTSAAGMKTDCAPKLVTYFWTGRLSTDKCEGVPVPRVTRARLPNTGGGRRSPTRR